MTELKSVDFLNPIFYSPDKLSYFKFPFTSLDLIELNYSQLHQDMFVLSLLNGMKGGFYIDIGASFPLHMNNTYLLENLFMWRGVSIEVNQSKVEKHRFYRKNPCYLLDALSLNYSSFMASIVAPKMIDYLSIDIEPAQYSLKVLREILKDKSYSFKVISFEHDYYNGGHKERAESRELLSSLGYSLLVPNVSWGHCCIEDWWIKPELIDPYRLHLMARENQEGETLTNIFDYFYTKYSFIN